MDIAFFGNINSYNVENQVYATCHNLDKNEKKKKNGYESRYFNLCGHRVLVGIHVALSLFLLFLYLSLQLTQLDIRLDFP